MPSNESLIQRIRERMDFDALFGEFLNMTGRAPWKSAKCIFHEDSNPSMGVNVEDGYYLCRNPECGVRGDFIDFYKRVRGLNFVEALAELAQRVGLEVETRASGGPVNDGAPGVIDEAIVTSASYRLLNTPTAFCNAP